LKVLFELFQDGSHQFAHIINFILIDGMSQIWIKSFGDNTPKFAYDVSRLIHAVFGNMKINVTTAQKNGCARE